MKRTATTRLKLIFGVALCLSFLGLWIAPRHASTQSACAAPVDGNVIYNPNFEDGKAGWQFFSNGNAAFETTTVNTAECSQSAEASIQNPGSNVQLFQTGITLQPATTYRLSLVARSTTGQDVRVFLQRHSAPYTGYGLGGETFDLSPDWQTFTTEFTTKNFDSTTTDSRLRIWMADSNIPGESYFFDQVSLVPISSPVATEMPTQTLPPPPTATDTLVPTATATATETTAPTDTPTATATATETTVPTDTPTATATATEPTAPTNTPMATQGPSQSQCAALAGGNVIQNPGFEDGATAWAFYSNGNAAFTATTTNPFDCARSAEIAIQTRGSNVQLFQTRITLQPATTYQLSLAARSTTGQDVRVFLQRHSAPYTDYGLAGMGLDLSPDWQTFTIEFTTKNFDSTTTDSRLRIWMADSNIPGESYYFDKVVLVPVSSPTATGTPPPSPTATNTTVPTATTAANTPTATSTATPTTAPTNTPTTAPTITPTATQGLPQGQCALPVSGNVIQNPGFEDGATVWAFFSDGVATFTATTTNPFDCARAAEVSIQTKGSNVQLFQSGITLQPATTYRLGLAARSTTGQDMKVFLHRYSAPYTNYGLNGINLNLTPSWQTFIIEFRTSGFTSTVYDGRLRFSMDESNIAGEAYNLDLVSLVAIPSGPQPTATNVPATPTPVPSNTPVPTKTPVGPTQTPTPTKTPGSPPSSSTEMVVFEWNQLVTTADRGFPRHQPPTANGNWNTPVNFAEGTLYYRAELRNMPTHKDMKIQYCVWQAKNGNNLKLENCGLQKIISYKGSKVVLTWSQEVQRLWMKGGSIIEWYRPRYRDGLAIKTPEGVPVSDYSGWNWANYDPADWYPMDLHFTVVVVAKGHTFSGWSNYP